MNPQIETLKTELREFISLSETITPGRWEQGDSGDMVYRQPGKFGQAAGIIIHGRNSGVTREQDERDAAFIARSRNISPTMAKMLLEVIEINECRAVWIAPCKAFPNGTPDNVSASTIQAILNLWNETK